MKLISLSRYFSILLNLFYNSCFRRIEEVEELVLLNENLKNQEIQFREHCKKELVQLQNKIE